MSSIADYHIWLAEQGLGELDDTREMREAYLAVREDEAAMGDTVRRFTREQFTDDASFEAAVRMQRQRHPELYDETSNEAVEAKSDQAWRDAYYIAWVGASNPKGVRNTLNKWLATFGSGHAATRAIAGHLAFLEGTSLGPDQADLQEVRKNAIRLGLMEAEGTDQS